EAIRLQATEHSDFNGYLRAPTYTVREMKYLGFIWRVLRRLVWETATDQTTGLAAQMAYLLLFALAPGSLFLWHLLGLFGTDPSTLHRMFLLLKSFMPPDPKVQDILD